MRVSKTRTRRKMTFVLLALMLGFAVVAGALVYEQLINAEFLQAKAAETRTQQAAVSAARGTIFDRNGEILAVSITADSVAVYPNQIKDEDAGRVADGLSSALGMERQGVYEKVTSDYGFAWVERKIAFDLAEKIEDMELPGVSIEEESQRYYPKGTLACHVLGFCGIDNDGLEGLEFSLDDVLSGVDGSVVGLFDSNGNPIVQEEYEYQAALDGSDVYLTIDTTIQYFCQRALDELQSSEHPALRVGMMVMEPASGKILAMACSETYDPNDYAAATASAQRNWLVADTYEPGSCFKVVTLSSAVEEGTVNANSTFYDGGAIDVYGTQIHCWASVPHGMQTLAEAVQNSCNPAFVQIGQSLERKEAGLFYKYIEAFGFGSKSGVSLPGEATGLVQAKAGPVELATISIGQGIAVTPLQMLTAVCAVANGGYLLQPQIVERVVTGDGQSYDTQRQVTRQVISSATADEVHTMMEGVVTGGSGANAAIDGYIVAGKTGTAQKPRDGGYAEGYYVASFVGIVGQGENSLAAIVVVDEPSGEHFGSQVAAPIFGSVMSDVVRYMGISPTEEIIRDADGAGDTQVYVPNLSYLDVDSAVTELRARGLTVEIVGDGPLVISQAPAGGALLDSGSTVAITAGGVIAYEDGTTLATIPNLLGKRYAEVAALLEKLGLDLIANGTGIAYQQSLSPGKAVAGGSAITVSFSQEKDTVTTEAP